MIYFVPEADEQLTGAGLRPGRMGYFASRAAPMGAVDVGVVVATFYNFNPELVARFIPRAWTLATREAILDARLAAADAALRRILGDTVAAADVAEAAELARAATTALRPEGRPLYAGHASLDWPDEPHLVLWHAASLLREYRGDGHVAALLAAGLTGIDAIVTHTATGTGFTNDAAKAIRGWSDEQWAEASDGLRARGLLDGDVLTPAGLALRQEVEDATDRMDRAACEHLGADRSERLIALGKAISRRIVHGGAFPAGVFAAKR